MVSNSTVYNIRNISLHEVVFATLFQKLITNNLVTRRHIQSVMILNAVDRIQDRTGGLEADIAQKGLKKRF